MNNTSQLIDSIESRVAMIVDISSLNLNRGVTEDQIAAAQEYIGLSFSEEFKELYYKYNGQHKKSPTFLGLTWLALQDICHEYIEWQKIVNDGVTNDILDEWSTSYPIEAIQLRYSSEGWLPLLTDNFGNFIGIDCNPGKSGISGQIINFGRDQEHKYVIAKSLTDLLYKILALLYKEDYIFFDKGKNMISLKNNIGVFDLISNGYFK